MEPKELDRLAKALSEYGPDERPKSITMPKLVYDRIREEIDYGSPFPKYDWAPVWAFGVFIELGK